ncbi:MAG TPA: ABC transporter substrate-binding protein [Pseudomonas sp.]|nr:ABC transporter substrate-binding protein [Pseudomonas sp.]MBB49596.1 ABC transporter substrate-binding protein [Pseudomonadales bacterium]MBF77843.1 ABC transporter substrate-binding protein [Pseudomonadales bacterium]HCA25785.1 ABC transporter substrate-binding protein [Pseudomonas sp.]|tara:strand:- start:3321 stop:4298 length:978 start_codon:yes stop_codon:yes gene_type:complete
MSRPLKAVFRRSRLLASVLAVASLYSTVTHAADTTVRIGFQKSSTLITLLRTQGTLEQVLGEHGVAVSWHEFPSGLPLLEALNVGNVDFSADVADTVPVFAQAAGAELTYVAQEAPSPSAQAIVVPTDSDITELADLKGRRVAVTKAAGSHYLLIQALRKAGLRFADITPSYLSPADGRAAFENGNVDAWVTWEPFLSSAERQLDVRVLADGRDGLADYQRYYLSSATFAEQHPEILALLFAELQRSGEWLREHPAEGAAIFGPLWGGLDAGTAEAAIGKRSYLVRAVAPASLSEQQRIADTFHGEGLLPVQVDARDVRIWTPED